MPLLLLFILVPIAEISIFAWVGGRIGVLGTIAMVLICAMAGAALLRHQGMSTLRRAQAIAAEGRIPSAELADGLVILVAAVMLITPGFLTDAVALLLLLPGPRHLVRRWLVSRVVARAQQGAVRHTSSGVFVQFGGAPPPGPKARDTEIIDDSERP